MKVMFVLPGVGKKENSPYIDTWKMEPLTISVLSGMTEGADRVFYDDRIETVQYDEPADLVAISAETYTAKRAYDIAAQFRRRNVPVVMGGYHPSFLPEEAIGHADSVVIGEAEGIWPKVIEDVRKGKLQKYYTAHCRPELSGIKPDRTIYHHKKYMPLTLVETSRGCSFSCTFCSITAFYRGSYRYRPPSEAAGEIAGLNANRVFLVDDNIGAVPDFTRRLCEELARLNIHWVSQCSISALRDSKLIELMAKSGCRGLLIGFESLDAGNLSSMNKAWNVSSQSYEEILKALRDNGIAVYATFIFGYDHDNEEVIDRTVEFAIRQKFFIAAFNHLVPFPGTALYRKLLGEGRLLYDTWWLDSRYRFGDIAFVPKGISPEKLSERCVEARKTFFSASSIISRAFDFGANCRDPLLAALYFSLNLKLRKEVGRKNGILLGQGLDS